MPPSWHWTDHSGGYWQQVEPHTEMVQANNDDADRQFLSISHNPWMHLAIPAHQLHAMEAYLLLIMMPYAV